MFKTLISLILLVIISAFLADRWYQSELDKPIKVLAPYELEVKSGQSFNSVAKQLELDGVIKPILPLKLYAKQKNLGNQIKAGNYILDSDLTIPALLEKLVKGKVTLVHITIPEGLTFKEMLTLISANQNIKHTLKGKTFAEIMTMIGHSDEHPEGRFLPETYAFAKGTTDIILLKKSYDAMENALAEAWVAKSIDSELKTPYEALILASIIEKETGVFDEQATIAGVFNSRLRKGMRLQTDPTVIYGMGELYQGDIRRKDLQTDTPYNTYTRNGLPPTPIALPGINAIKASVNPEKHNKLYFVATGDNDGRHYFSTTLEEHQLAVQRYLKKYRQNISKK